MNQTEQDVLQQASRKEHFKKLLNYVKLQFSSSHQTSRIVCDCVYKINLILCNLTTPSLKEKFWKSFVEKAVIGVLTAKELKQKSLRIKKNCFHFAASLLYTSKRFRSSLLSQFDVLFSSLQEIGAGVGHSVEVLEAFQALKLDIYASLFRWCQDFESENSVLRLWKSKIKSLQKKKEEESAKEKELRLKKYIVIFRRNKEELEELKPVIRESQKIINNAIEVGIEGKGGLELEEGHEEIKVESKIEIEEPALVESVIDQKKMLERRVEPLLKLFHDQTFTLLQLTRIHEGEELIKEEQIQDLLEKLNGFLIECEDLRRKADRLSKQGEQEEEDEDEMLFRLYAKK